MRQDTNGGALAERALFLVNRNSRSGASNTEALIERLAAGGLEVVVPALANAGQIPELIRQHASEVQSVVVGGGDGSLNSAAGALLETGLPLGILPLGTANDLARTLGIPLEPEPACDVITNGVRHRIDLGRVNGRYFFNVANIGFGVQVAHELSPELKQRWGILSYFAGFARAIRRMRSFRAEIVCDGRRQGVRSVQIAVGNGRYYGGGMTVAAPACIDDALFFVYSIAPLGLIDLLRMLVRAPALHEGRFGDADPVDLEQGQTIEVHTRRPMLVSADGEMVAHTPAHFELMAGALEVFVPAAYFHDRQEILHAAQG
jgi:diacylglycerol kinase (ATP)